MCYKQSNKSTGIIIPVLQERNVQCKDSMDGSGPLQSPSGTRRFSSAVIRTSIFPTAVNWQMDSLNTQPSAGQAHLVHCRRQKTSAKEEYSSRLQQKFYTEGHQTSNVGGKQSERFRRQICITPEVTQSTYHTGIKKKNLLTQMPAHAAMAPARQQRHIGTTIICPFTNMLLKKHPYASFQLPYAFLAKKLKHFISFQ